MILSNRFSLCFLAGEWKKVNLYGEFLCFLASRQLMEVTGMIMAVLSVTFRFSKNMATKKVLYQIPDSYLINHLLWRSVCDGKCYIFRELNNVSLTKVMDFCYDNTAYSCAGTDDCYYCRIVDYIKDEFRSRWISDHGYCVIQHKGKRESKCFHSCRSNGNLHYDLM